MGSLATAAVFAASGSAGEGAADGCGLSVGAGTGLGEAAGSVGGVAGREMAGSTRAAVTDADGGSRCLRCADGR